MQHTNKTIYIYINCLYIMILLLMFSHSDDDEADDDTDADVYARDGMRSSMMHCNYAVEKKLKT